MADKNYFEILFGNGLNTSKPKQKLGPGELVQAVGVWYPQGTEGYTAQQIPGRATLKSFPMGGDSKGVKYLAFDNPSTVDQILGYAGSGYYIGAVSAGGPMAYVEAASASGAHMFAAHHSDRFYVVNGYSENRVIDDTLTFRPHGMFAPYQFSPDDFGVGVGGDIIRPSGYSLTGLANVWRNPGNGIDISGTDTYAEGSPQDVGLSYMYYSGFPNQIMPSGSYINISYSTSVGGNAANVYTPNNDNGENKDNEKTNYGRASWSCWYSLSGSGWTSAYFNNFTSTIPRSDIQIPLPENYNLSGLRLQFLMNCTKNYPSQSDFVSIYDTAALGLSGVGDPAIEPFSTVSGLRYGVSEYDSKNAIESEPWINRNLVTLSSGLDHNSVTIELPTTAVNENTTHFRIYRSPDGLDGIQYLGLIGEVPVGTSRFVDTFSIDKDSVALPLYPVLGVGVGDGSTSVYAPLTRRPTRWKSIASYQGSLVGIDALNPRMLWYTPPGFPDYSPEPYRVSSFPLPDHDELVGAIGIERILLVFAKDTTFSIQGLPLIGDGETFSEPPVFRMGGVPGCVGPKAFTEIVDEAGRAAGAWVARNGIYISDGNASRLLTSEIKWNSLFSASSDKSKIVLFWHKDERLLCMFYPSSSGNNNRYLLIHLDQIKESGYPKITGPHYGNIRDIDDGVYQDEYQVYSVHPEFKFIYREFYGTQDQSYAYNSSDFTIPIILETGRIYDHDSYKDFQVDRVVVDHTHFHGAQSNQNVSGLFQIKQGEDYSNAIQTKSVAMNLSGYRGTELPVDAAGQWMELKVIVSGVVGSADSAIHAARVLLSKSRQSGDR